jgi:hypothetical protein
MVSETYIFIILLSKIQFSTDLKWRMACQPKLNFFQILKRQYCSTKTQDTPKNCKRKFSKMVDIFKMAFILCSNMKICLVTVILVSPPKSCQRCIQIDSFWMEIKAVYDHLQNFVWSQDRGLYVILAFMWALGSEPTGPKLCRAHPWLYINEKQPG